MHHHRVARVAIIFAVLLSVVAGLAGTAQAQEGAPLWFESASASCTAATYSFRIETMLGSPQRPPQQVAAIPVLVEAYDSDGSFLGATSGLYPFEPGTYAGSVAFDHQPASPVTLDLYSVPGAFVGGVLSAPSLLFQEEMWMLADQIQVPVDCSGAPGCDQLIPMNGAVVGQFVQTTDAYWKPDAGSLTNPLITIAAGKTLWAFGVDASGQYVKVLLGCSFVWVPRGTIGPNPDSLWNNTPLPTTVVQ